MRNYYTLYQNQLAAIACKPDRQRQLLIFVSMAAGLVLNVRQVNYLNIFLMIGSAALAFVLPFELFMFSYVVLGPLHYLTEMAWLHQRQYFVNGARAWWLLALCGVGVIIFYVADFVLLQSAGNNSAQAQGLSALFRNWLLNFILLASIIGLVLVTVIDKWWRLMLICMLTMLLVLFNPYREVLIAVAILIPTIVHTCLFLLAFILLGAIKSKSFSGYLSVLVFVVCCVSFFVTGWGIAAYDIHPRVLQNLEEGFFLAVNDILGNLTGNGFNTIADTLYSPWGIRIQQFIAFVYTYHYLNWFSKTNIINWHQVPRSWALSIVFLWILLVSLYLIDFKTGLLAIFLLSMLHVFLEFPLNYRSILGIGTHFWKSVKQKP